MSLQYSPVTEAVKIRMLIDDVPSYLEAILQELKAIRAALEEAARRESP